MVSFGAGKSATAYLLCTKARSATQILDIFFVVVVVSEEEEKKIYSPDATFHEERL